MPTPADPPNPYAIPPIYLVTMLLVVEEGGRERVQSHRTWGWHPTKALAEEAILLNDGDQWENDYTHALIEECTPGSLAMCDTRWWYRATRAGHEVRGVHPIDEPAFAAGVLNYGMG